MTPQRIQRRRTKGWQMPEGAVYVGRPSRWGNRFKPGMFNVVLDREMTVRDTVERFRANLAAQLEAAENNPLLWAATKSSLDELRGKDLVCWCPLAEPCHADVLLEIANRSEVHAT